MPAPSRPADPQPARSQRPCASTGAAPEGEPYGREHGHDGGGAGPVDYLVIEFPAGDQNFTGEAAEELAKLAESGIIRVLDVLILSKNEDGSVDALEIDDTPEVDAIRALEADIAEILAADDVELLAAAMEPGSVAGVLVCENRWAAPFAAAARRAGGSYRHRPDPDPGHRRVHRARAGPGRRKLTCLFVPHAQPAAA